MKTCLVCWFVFCCFVFVFVLFVVCCCCFFAWRLKCACFHENIGEEGRGGGGALLAYGLLTRIISRGTRNSEKA